MEAAKKIKESLQLSFPRVPPYELNYDYFFSKTFLQQLKFPEVQWDRPREDVMLQLISTNRVLERTKRVLEGKRQFFKETKKKLKVQWVDLREKELALRDNVMFMQTFVQSNFEKRRRAKVRLVEDKILFQERVKDIDRLKVRMDSTEKSKLEMDQNMAQLKIYEQYLNKVVAIGEDFKNSDDIVSRYETLSNTRNELGKVQDATMIELENAQMKTAKMAEHNKLIIMGLNTVLAELRARYTTALNRSLEMELLVMAVRNNMFTSHQSMATVKQSCWNLYKLMAKRKGEKSSIREEDTEKQVAFIKKMFQLFQIIKESHPKMFKQS